jgi:trk system potassium uptake protein TrkA
VLDEDRRVVGTLSVSDIVRAYRQELAGSAERMNGLGLGAGAAQITLRAHSPLAGKSLRQADLPSGLLVTSVTRGDRVFVPNGDTVLAAGDRLSVLGQAGDLENIGDLEPLDPPPLLHNGSSPPGEE